MSSLRSHPPARTPSRTSHAFRTNQNDHFSPFGSLAELNAANAQLAPPPPHGSHYAGSDRDRATPQHGPRSKVHPPEEDDLGSFYGEEVDYGNVTSQLHPNNTYFPPGSSRSYQGSQHGGSQLPSHAGTGWGSRPESIHERAASPGKHPYGAYGTHHAYDYEEEFAPPNPPFRQWEGSRAASVASHARQPSDTSRQPIHTSPVPLQQWHGSHAHSAQHEYDHEHDREVNYVPTIQVESPYPELHSSRTPSPAATFHQPVIRTMSSRASIHQSPEPVDVSRGQYDHELHNEPEPMLTHRKSRSSRSASRKRPPSRRVSTQASRTTMYSLPAHFETDGDNVLLQVWLPWTELLNEQPCRFHITGVDGKSYSLEVDYRWTKMVHGSAKFRGAGMPRSQARGRGNLTVEWEITWPNDHTGSISD